MLDRLEAKYARTQGVATSQVPSLLSGLSADDPLVGYLFVDVTSHTEESQPYVLQPHSDGLVRCRNLKTRLCQQSKVLSKATIAPILRFDNTEIANARRLHVLHASRNTT
jgi:hypothetical protein